MSEYKESYSCPHGKIFERIDLSETQAIETLKDFMKNPDDYFSKKYPHIPLKFYDSVKYAIEKLDQPTLNENQQIVLDYLKDKCNVCSFISHKPFEAILRLSMLDPEKTELRVINTIDELTYKQQAQVIEVFSKWAQEQAEE